MNFLKVCIMCVSLVGCVSLDQILHSKAENGCLIYPRVHVNRDDNFKVEERIMVKCAFGKKDIPKDKK